ncbi:MAG TPA: hypothetical protein VN031_00770, partial [Candidatus Microsaccharimonas sp.]|nr:hypothetical protein [Candidatus Microsaccharimonas sp.]
WLVNGQPAGATNLNPGDSVAYTASAAPGYEIAAGAQTSFVFANVFDTKTCQPVVIIDHGPKGHHTPPSAGHVVGPQLGTGSDGPTGLQNVSTTSPTLLYTIAGLLALLGLSLSGGGMLVLSRVRRGTHRQ